MAHALNVEAAPLWIPVSGEHSQHPLWQGGLRGRGEFGTDEPWHFGVPTPAPRVPGCAAACVPYQKPGEKKKKKKLNVDFGARESFFFFLLSRLQEGEPSAKEHRP